MPDRDDRHPGSYRHNPSPYPNPSHFPDSQVRRPFKPALTVVRDIPVGEHGEVGVLQAFLASLENPAGRSPDLAHRRSFRSWHGGRMLAAMSSTRCPICSGDTHEIRAKLICRQCGAILETCCEGGPMTGGCDPLRPRDDRATGPPAQPESSIDSRRG